MNSGRGHDIWYLEAIVHGWLQGRVVYSECFWVVVLGLLEFVRGVSKLCLWWLESMPETQNHHKTPCDTSKEAEECLTHNLAWSPPHLTTQDIINLQGTSTSRI